jgi:hypothetical protein
MKQGDRVCIYPQGKPALSAFATVAIISGNQRSIAVGFDHNPQFPLFDDPLAFHPSYGVMLFATRDRLPYDAPSLAWGPWTDIFGGGRYEIEAL